MKKLLKWLFGKRKKQLDTLQEKHVKFMII